MIGFSAVRVGAIGVLFLLALVSCDRRHRSEPPHSAHQAAHAQSSVQVNRLFERLSQFDSTPTDAQVADQLEALGVSAIPFIEPRLTSESQRERVVALIALQRLNAQRGDAEFSEDAVQRYLERLSDEHVMVRTYAMESLIQAGRRFRTLVKAYQEHSSPDVRARLDIVLREMR